MCLTIFMATVSVYQVEPPVVNLKSILPTPMLHKLVLAVTVKSTLLMFFTTVIVRDTPCESMNVEVMVTPDRLTGHPVSGV